MSVNVPGIPVIIYGVYALVDYRYILVHFDTCDLLDDAILTRRRENSASFLCIVFLKWIQTKVAISFAQKTRSRGMVTLPFLENSKIQIPRNLCASDRRIV